MWPAAGGRVRAVIYPDKATTGSAGRPMSEVLSRSGAPSASPGDKSGLGSGLVVDRIGKAFRGRQVVKQVSLHLARGEVAGLLGP